MVQICQIRSRTGCIRFRATIREVSSPWKKKTRLRIFCDAGRRRSQEDGRGGSGAPAAVGFQSEGAASCDNSGCIGPTVPARAFLLGVQETENADIGIPPSHPFVSPVILPFRAQHKGRRGEDDVCDGGRRRAGGRCGTHGRREHPVAGGQGWPCRDGFKWRLLREPGSAATGLRRAWRRGEARGPAWQRREAGAAQAA